MAEKQEIVNSTKYPDSLELDFGGTRKGAKVYFDASNIEDAKERVSKMKEIAVHAEKKLAEFRMEGDSSE